MRIFSVSLVMVALVFGVACGSKKKVEDEGKPAGMGDPEIGSKAISFDPLGSDSGNINGLTTVNFEYDRASLTTSARRALADNASWMKAKSNLTIQVEGHCDARGSVEYNLALGERRAKAVKDYMVSLGVDSKMLTIISYGKSKPLVLGDTDDDHTKNRRANFVPLPN